jgi:hypothetical protein
MKPKNKSSIRRPLPSGFFASWGMIVPSKFPAPIAPAQTVEAITTHAHEKQTN